jgi:hypothetical protein
MANYNISVPANVDATGLSLITNNLSVLQSSLKSKYGSIVSECSKNSNVPEALIYSMIIAVSNGENNSSFLTNDYTTAPLLYTPLTRMGLFSLSNRTARVALLYEINNQRMNDAERAYLNKYGNEWVKLYIQKERPSDSKLGVNKWWQSGKAVNVRSINDSLCLKNFAFNLNSPEVSIAIGTSIIGQAWDYYGKINNDPLGSVISSILFPFDNNYDGVGNSYPFNKTILQEIMNKFKIYKFDNADALAKLPRPDGKIENNRKVGFGIVINPKANNPRIANDGYVVSYLSSVIGKGGILQNLVNNQV